MSLGKYLTCSCMSFVCFGVFVLYDVVNFPNKGLHNSHLDCQTSGLPSKLQLKPRSQLALVLQLGLIPNWIKISSKLPWELHWNCHCTFCCHWNFHWNCHQDYYQNWHCPWYWCCQWRIANNPEIVIVIESQTWTVATTCIGTATISKFGCTNTTKIKAANETGIQNFATAELETAWTTEIRLLLLLKLKLKWRINLIC